MADSAMGGGAPMFDLLRAGATAWDVVSGSRADAAMLAQRQRQHLAELLRSAQAHSPWYASQLPADAARLPLTALPVQRRRELMRHFNDWVCDRQVRRADVDAFVHDAGRMAQPFMGRYTIWESSGTSGEPGIFLQDASAMAVYDSLESLRYGNASPSWTWPMPLGLGERIAFVGATDGHFASCVSVQRLRQRHPWMTPNLQVFSILQPVDTLVRALNEWRPSIIATYPTAAALLAEQAQTGALRIAPREIWTGGETLEPALRRHVQQVFDCRMRNSYGASEFLAMGWECEHGAMHLNSDWVILEPVDDDYRPVPPGQQSTRVLLTNLANKVQPLIRYELEDQITFSPHPCACGSALPVIHIDGRGDDLLRMDARTGGTVLLLPLALSTVMEEHARVYDFQLRQCDGRTLALRLGQPTHEAADALRRCRQALQQFGEAQGLAPIKLLDETTLPMVRSRSGKLRRVLACEAG
ncbi:AMP-binding protein [Azohydromonas lata]|uniref:Phenylacetate--CoA ligase family protein n=1 Tax=Azohydromonas lata TaxID=45677 RepID=A0ABU5INC1_9BURK|nr:AMP-binding protein [Azohydromonas lata]MDZ5460413.1 phenylacetate--CoA ligase family protein [Azohydromonas lata]